MIYVLSAVTIVPSSIISVYYFSICWSELSFLLLVLFCLRRMLGDAKFGWKWPVVDTLDDTRLIPFLSFFPTVLSLNLWMLCLLLSFFFENI